MKKKFTRIICCVIIILIVATSGCVAPPKETNPTSTATTQGNFFNPSQTPTTTTKVPAPYIDRYPDAMPLNSDFHIENTLDDLRYPPQAIHMINHHQQKMMFLSR